MEKLQSTDGMSHEQCKLAVEAAVASPERRLHLINAIRVWLNRAITHAENGNADKAESAARSAREILGTLETLCR